MASLYSDLKIELIGTGDQAGTWGVTTNTNLGTALEEAITGSADVTFSSADVTLTLTDTPNSQAGRNLRLNLTGTSGGARNLILGTDMQIDKLYLINNGLSDTVTVKNTTGTGIAVPAGKTMFVFNNGTNVVDAITYLTSLETASLVATTADINGGSVDGATLGTNSAITSLVATTADINGGSVDGATLGTNSAITSLVATTADINGGSIDGATLGTNSAITEADIDNININGNTISTTDTDGSLTLTPDGTGEVVTSKFMAGVFSDRVVALGNLGAATTLNASQGTVYTATLDQSSTLTLGTANATANRATSFTLVLTNGSGGPFTLTLAGGTFKYPNGSVSRTTADGAIDIWFFFTPDGGTTYYVTIPMKNLST
jgi:hypothetical protein